MAALHRAIALAEMDGIALAIGQHLDFHMARIFQKFFHVDHVVVERGLGFLLSGGD